MPKELRSVFFEPDVIAKIHAIAEGEGRSFGDVVRRLVDAGLARDAEIGEWRQAAWDAYGILGFDQDGDRTPEGLTPWGPEQLRDFAREAREISDSA